MEKTMSTKANSSADNKALVEAMYAALAKQDAESFFDAMSDDARWTIIGSTDLSRTFDGKEAIVKELLEPFMAMIDGDFAIVPEQFIAEGDRVVMLSKGKSKTTFGKDYNNTYCHVFRVTDGKVREVTEYCDTELIRAAFSA